MMSDYSGALSNKEVIMKAQDILGRRVWVVVKCFRGNNEITEILSGEGDFCKTSVKDADYKICFRDLQGKHYYATFYCKERDIKTIVPREGQESFDVYILIE